MIVSHVHSTVGGESLIVQMARVSSPKNATNLSTAPRLLRYLIRHQHWSPFEMATLCVRIDTERDIAAQLLRHKSFAFQEWSQRYADVREQGRSIEAPMLRRQDRKNRQSSHDDLPWIVRVPLGLLNRSAIAGATFAYGAMLRCGVAKETARRILPLCTPTTLYMHGSLRSWIHYIQVRTDPGTQLEHRQIALACRDVFATHFPTIADAAFTE
jgi:thymidylate synthase (FAD)